MTAVYVGDRAVITSTFTQNSVNTNPDNVVVKYETPSGTQGTLTPTNPETGVYKTSIRLTASGRWYIKVVATDNADEITSLDGADYAFIDVRPTRLD